MDGVLELLDPLLTEVPAVKDVNERHGDGILLRKLKLARRLASTCGGPFWAYHPFARASISSAFVSASPPMPQVPSTACFTLTQMCARG